MAPRPDNCPVPDAECPADRLQHGDTRRLAPADMDILEQHLGLVLGSVEEIGSKALTPEHITEAVQAGLIAALSDERTWAAAAAGIRASAHREAGQILVGALAGALRKAGMFVGAGLLVYWIGGWSAIAAVWHALFGGKP